MKKVFFTLFVLSGFLLSTAVQAQTAEEIVDMYFETLGGKDKIAAIKSSKATCTAKAQGMELPVVMINKAPNKVRMDMNFQGQEITQMAFDGETGWGVNFMTMEPEAYDQMQSDIMASQTDVPDPLLNYKEKGYTIELMEEEEVEGVECYVVKLTRKPIMIDDKEEENASLFYMDKENGILIKQRDYAMAGPAKGSAVDTYFSDYDEVDGVYFAFTIIQKMNEMEVFSVSIDTLELNVEIDDSYFSMPKE